jgi:hypothetical protein
MLSLGSALGFYDFIICVLYGCLTNLLSRRLSEWLRQIEIVGIFVARYVFADAGRLHRFAVILPKNIWCNRLIPSLTVSRTRQHICIGLHPAPMLA